MINPHETTSKTPRRVIDEIWPEQLKVGDEIAPRGNWIGIREIDLDDIKGKLTVTTYADTFADGKVTYDLTEKVRARRIEQSQVVSDDGSELPPYTATTLEGILKHAQDVVNKFGGTVAVCQRNALYELREPSEDMTDLNIICFVTGDPR